jgi:2-methylfumaryl-CoA isomerase
MYNLLPDLSLVEVSSFVASPTAGLYLAQMGADVIRVDQIGGGQDFRRWPVTRGGDSLSWENLNRAKRSLALDLTRGEGRELLVELCQRVGNLITNLPAKGFLAHDRLAAGRADMISVRVMGWPDGAVALDYTANAAVGYPGLTGPLDDPAPVNHVLPAWDLLTGAYAAFAMLAAIRRRVASGLGGEVRLPLTDVAMGTVANMGRVAEVLYTGQERERLGNAVFGTIGRDFVTRDGVRLMLVAINERQWAGLVAALGIGERIAALETALGLSFAGDDGLRFTHRAGIFAIIEQAIGALDHDKVAAQLDAQGVVHSRYQSTAAAVGDPRLVGGNPMFAPCDTNPSGFAYPAAGAFATIPQAARLPAAPAPRNGEHSEAVLAERLGLDSGAIARLVDAGIVGLAHSPNS